MSYEGIDKVYCYQDTNVLKNKFNIKDNDTLTIKEKAYTGFRILQLEKGIAKVVGNFDLKHLQNIHEYIFQDVYSWAGKLRNVDISKGIWFARSEFVASESKKLFTELKNEQYLKSYDNKKFCERLAYYKTEINLLHPFREGNGRTIREFIRQLAKYNDYNLDYSKASKSEYMDAMIKSPGNTDELNKILNKCISPINIKNLVVELYENDFPAIKLISDKAAGNIYDINKNSNKPYSIKDFKDKYKEIGKCLDQGNEQYSKEEFNIYKNIVDDLKAAKLKFIHNKAEHPDKIKTFNIEL